MRDPGRARALAKGSMSSAGNAGEWGRLPAVRGESLHREMGLREGGGTRRGFWTGTQLRGLGLVRKMGRIFREQTLRREKHGFSEGTKG